MAGGSEDALCAVAETVRQRGRGRGPHGGGVGIESDHGNINREVGLAVGATGAASLATPRHLKGCGLPSPSK